MGYLFLGRKLEKENSIIKEKEQALLTEKNYGN